MNEYLYIFCITSTSTMLKAINMKFNHVYAQFLHIIKASQNLKDLKIYFSSSQIHSKIHFPTE